MDRDVRKRILEIIRIVKSRTEKNPIRTADLKYMLNERLSKAVESSRTIRRDLKTIHNANIGLQLYQGFNNEYFCYWEEGE